MSIGEWLAYTSLEMMHCYGCLGVIMSSLLLILHMEYDWMMNFEYLKNFTIFEKFKSLN